MTPPEYLLEAHMMAAKPAERAEREPRRSARRGTPSRSRAEIAYFNTATLSPQLHRVRAAGEAALERRSRPWRSPPTDWFADVERLRDAVRGLVGADADGIALVPATSYVFAVAARNLACWHR